MPHLVNISEAPSLALHTMAVGAKRSREAPYPGADATGVIGGVEFLRDVALGDAPSMGRRMVVVGGGDAAMDSDRTAQFKGHKPPASPPGEGNTS